MTLSNIVYLWRVCHDFVTWTIIIINVNKSECAQGTEKVAVQLIMKFEIQLKKDNFAFLQKFV